MAPPATKYPITTKHYIMAALTATLAAAVVITIVVVVLSPARILFSITNAQYLLPSTNTTGDDDEGMMQLTLTVAANNTSRRTRVEYCSIFIDVSNSTGPQWVNWVRATVNLSVPLFQATRNVTNIYAVAPLAGGLWMDAIVNDTNSFRVMITALARFRAGITPTRLYEIKVSCSPITFLPEEANKGRGGAPVACGSG
jgi:hypothetical protein